MRQPAADCAGLLRAEVQRDVLHVLVVLAELQYTGVCVSDIRGHGREEGRGVK